MRAWSGVVHPILVRESHSLTGGESPSGGVTTTVGGLFVGPMLTTIISTCSSPVMTLPLWLPPESAVPPVEFEIPPPAEDGVFGAVTVGLVGCGAGSETRPDTVRSRSPMFLTSA